MQHPQRAPVVSASGGMLPATISLFLENFGSFIESVVLKCMAVKSPQRAPRNTKVV